MLRLTFSKPVRGIPFFGLDEQIRFLITPTLERHFIVKSIETMPDEKVKIVVVVKPDAHITKDSKSNLGEAFPANGIAPILIGWGVFAGITGILMSIFGMQLEKVEKLISSPIGGLLGAGAAVLAIWVGVNLFRGK